MSARVARLAAVAAAVVGAVGFVGPVRGATPGTAAVPIADQLLAVKYERTSEITTRGRRTGNPHTVTVSFAVEGHVLCLSTLDGRRDWVRNALANPTVTIEFGSLVVSGRFEDVTQKVGDLRSGSWAETSVRADGRLTKILNV